MATNYGVISTGVTLHLRADSLSLYSCYRVIRGINASVKLLGIYAVCFKCLNEERYSFTLTLSIYYKALFLPTFNVFPTI